MKLAWITHGLVADAAQVDGTPETQAEVERLLAVMRTVQADLTRQTSEGLEIRVLAAVQASSDGAAEAGRLQSILKAGLRGWAPLSVAASLLCVFAGGFVVARESALATPLIQDRQQAAGSLPASTPVLGSSRPGVGGVEAVVGPHSLLSTAAARRRPASPVPAGHRRGRAATAVTQSHR